MQLPLPHAEIAPTRPRSRSRLLLLLLTSWMLMATLAPLRHVSGEQVQQRLDRMAAGLRSSLQAFNGAPAADINCDFFRACPANEGFGTFPTFNFTPDTGFGGVPVDRGKMIFKQPVPPDNEFDASMHGEACRVVSSMGPVWRDTLEANPRDVLWQYAGFDDGLSAWYPSMDWPKVNTCPGTYRVQQRPWYLAGRSGQFDVVFLVDVTAEADDVAMMRAFVEEMLGTLSFRIFVNVIAYDSLPALAFGTMQRATVAGVPGLQAAARRTIESKQQRATSGAAPDLHGALVAAVEMLGVSTEAGDTSECDQIIVLLSSGKHSGSLAELDDISFGGATVLAYVIDTGEKNPPQLAPSVAVCATDGFIVANPNSTREMVDAVYTYLAAGLDAADLATRAAEVYSDAFTAEAVTTLTMPVSGGMLAVDVKLTGLDGNQSDLNSSASIDVINAAILQNQQCEERAIPRTAAVAAQGGKDTCASLGAEREAAADNPLERHRATIIAVSICGTYAISIFAMLVAWKRENAKMCAGLAAALLLFWPLFFGLLYSRPQLWDTVVRRQYWRMTDVTTESREIQEFRCCEVVGCSCDNTVSPPCALMLAQLKEGSCDKGYHCCRQSCYSCGCRSNGGCSTCCSCARSVSHRRCESVCGTCRNVIMHLT